MDAAERGALLVHQPGGEHAERRAEHDAFEGNEGTLDEEGAFDGPRSEAECAEDADGAAAFADGADHDDPEAGDTDEQAEGEEASMSRKNARLASKSRRIELAMGVATRLAERKRPCRLVASWSSEMEGAACGSALEMVAEDPNWRITAVSLVTTGNAVGRSGE